MPQSRLSFFKTFLKYYSTVTTVTANCHTSHTMSMSYCEGVPQEKKEIYQTKQTILQVTPQTIQE